MSQWIFPTTRWAIYLRDGLRCVYCQITLAEILEERGENFLTLDHMRPRSLKSGRRVNHPRNLITCCYNCNMIKNKGSIRGACRRLGLPQGAVWSRISRARSRDIERFRPAAKLLLGRLACIPDARPADIVVDHDWIVKRQWGDDLDGRYWEHLKEQEALFCPTCNAPREKSYSEIDWAAEETDWNVTNAPF